MINRRHLLLSMKLLFTVGIFWLLYRHSQLQFSLMVGFIHHPWQSLLIIALCLLIVVFHSWRWYRLNAAQNIVLPFSRTLLPAYMTLAFNSVLPGNVGGDFFRMYFVLKKFPAQKSNAVLAIFVDRLTGLLGIILTACITAPFYLDAFEHNATLYYLIMSCVIICAGSLFLFFLFAALLSDKIGLMNWLEQRLQHQRYAKPCLSLLRAMYLYRNAKLVFLQSLLASVGAQIVVLGILVLIERVMNLPPLSFGVYMLASVIAQVANLIPLTPGGLGVGEAAFANIIYLLHPTTAAYATVFFAMRVFCILAYLPGVFMGVFGYGLSNKLVPLES